jgi:hypothetical protein
MSDCLNNCNEIKSTKGGYVPPAANCSKKCKKEIIVKEELADIFLSNNEIVELSPANAEIGTFTSGINERGFFVLHSDFAGQNDNDKFIIKDNKLKIKQVLYYTPGITYKVTIKYSGLRHYKQKDFDIIITNSQDNSTPISGEQVQVSSSGGNIELTFDNIITAGEVTFGPIDSTDGLFCDINTACDFDGNIAVSFNNPGISPSNDPAIYHIKYDSELDQVFYDNVTTEVVEGKITGVVDSLGSFIVQFAPPPVGWGFPPSESLGFSSRILSGLACGTFNLNFQNLLPPCPGNQTRSGFNINFEDGTFSPFGNCGCWVDSGATVDGILAAASLYSLAKSGVCALIKTIANLRSALSSLANLISYLKSSMALLQNTIRNFMSQATTFIAAAERIFILKEANLARIAAAEKLIKDVEKALSTKRLTDRERAKLNQIKNTTNNLIRELNTLNEKYKKDAQPLVAKYQEFLKAAEAKKAEAALKAKEISLKQQDLLSKQAALKAAQDSQPGVLALVGTALAGLYSAVNSIKTEKTCPNGQTLRQTSCECCPNCANGRVFTSQSSCDCGCPPDKEPCTEQGVPGCHTPCTAGQILAGCTCITIIPTCIGYCRYGYNNTFQEWQYSSNTCSENCSCPSTEYVNANEYPNGCSNGDPCAVCDIECNG